MTDSRPTVVLIDDEDMVITSIRAYLALEGEFNVQGFTEPQRAIEFMQSTPFDVAVSDFLMPRFNGIEVLAKARQFQPDASRVLLTGHADKNSAISAINDVGLYQYLEKPWDNAQLLLVVRSGIERARLLRDLRITVGELAAANSSLRDVQTRLVKAFL